MNTYLEIAVPLETNAITFFIGTGFSKYLTEGKAPSWLELIVRLTQIVDTDRRKLHNRLFNTNESGDVISAKMELSICAQILELQFKKKKLDIRKSVVDVINDTITSSTINKSKVDELKTFFRDYPNINFITTNYDTVLSDYVLDGYPRVFVDGSPIPKSNLGSNIYHIHGCITKPASIVLTINDYFRFQHRDNYLSRKFYTLLQENTVVILGYSLGDFSLNRIFNEAQVSKSVSLRRSDIYLLSRDFVDPIYKDFYSFSYGINVIDDTEISEFISDLSMEIPNAKELVSEVGLLRNVINGTHVYRDDFLKLGSSFAQILLQATTIGVSINEAKFVEVLLEILMKKKEFTYESGAWSQYVHLADWLIELAIVVDITKTQIKDQYLELVKYSFNTMSEKLLLGYSWGAYRSWKSRLSEIKIENQDLIRNLIKKNFSKRRVVAGLLS
ncbi:MAG: SIR2 family NAD-dependent protein deacylase [Planctomycetota bacterium]|jgi:hypothetical protein